VKPSHLSSQNKLLIATTNLHKAQELWSGLASKLPHLELCTLRDFPAQEEVIEDAATFLENARIKALAYSQRLGLPCVADDSGLCVDILNGASGIYSARFAGPAAKDADNNAHLVETLRPYGPGPFVAHYTCALVYMQPNQTALEALGHWQGHIHLTPKGLHGFGYDPYFVPLGSTQSVAELSPQDKANQSHRALALRALLDLFYN